MKLRQKFLLPMVGLTLVGLTFLTMVLFMRSSAAVESLAKDYLTNVAKNLDERLTDLSDESLRSAQTNALDQGLVQALSDNNDSSFAQESRRLLERKKLFAQVDQFVLIDLQGMIRASDGTVNVDVSQRDYFRKAKETGLPAISEVLVSKTTGKQVQVQNVPVSKDGKILGFFATVTQVDWLMERLVKNLKLGQTGYAFMADKSGQFLYHPDPTLKGKGLKDTAWGPTALATDDGFASWVKDGSRRTAYVKVNAQTGFRLGVLIPDSELYAANQEILTLSIIVAVAVILVISLVVFLVIGVLVGSIRKGISFAQVLASGDLRTTLDIKSKDEIGDLARALNSMRDRLVQVITDIGASTDAVEEGSRQVADSSQDLSSGSSEQAANIEEVSSSMEEMAASIQKNSDNARQTEAIAVQTSLKAEEGGQAVAKTLEAMKQIASQIAVIDDIARSTNLLALNAAIEAARAGEAGKGFSVVASEVRKLAERSQSSAGQIMSLASGSVAIAETAGKAIADILPAIRQTTELIQEISAALSEQASGTTQINTAVLQLDSVIQRNAGASEELASMAEEMAAQSRHLMETLAYFKVEGA